MFKKLHRQMTFFCTLITGIIIVSMSVICLYFSESGLNRNAYASFTSDIESMIMNLGNQTVISYEWIAQMENGSQYIIHLSNNGNPILYDQLRSSEDRESLVTRAKFIAEDSYSFSLNSLKSTILSDHIEFVMEDAYGNNYYVSTAVIPKTNGHISAVIICSLASLNSQIRNQRFVFLLINIAAIILLGIFSYFFTKKMITPLEESRLKQNQFIASASHELRTPLAVILSSLSALKKAGPQDAERFSAAIESEGNRMSHLINDLLTLASADSQSWTMQPELIELDTLLLNAYEKYEPLAARKKLQMEVVLPDQSLPKCKGDTVRLEQIFSILIDNAISYTPENGAIRLSLAYIGGKLEIRVADSGRGIPDSQKEQIWERFYRADTSRTTKKHFGLGLSIAREIVRLHRGKIWVEDTPGGGATFVLLLPAGE